MASNAAVQAALKMLARVFAGEITPEKVAMYAAALDDVSDEEVAASVAVLVKHHTGEFLPVPAKIREACGANGARLLDVDGAVNAIEALGFYLPTTGWRGPSVGTVRDHLGSVMANAYGAIGGSARLFAEGETSRMIALRDFGAALRQATVDGERRLLLSGEDPREGLRMLSPGPRGGEPLRLSDILAKSATKPT